MLSEFLLLSCKNHALPCVKVYHCIGYLMLIVTVVTYFYPEFKWENEQMRQLISTAYNTYYERLMESLRFIINFL
jgi:hypothetical protein